MLKIATLLAGFAGVLFAATGARADFDVCNYCWDPAMGASESSPLLYVCFSESEGRSFGGALFKDGRTHEDGYASRDYEVETYTLSDGTTGILSARLAIPDGRAVSYKALDDSGRTAEVVTNFPLFSGGLQATVLSCNPAVRLRPIFTGSN